MDNHLPIIPNTGKPIFGLDFCDLQSQREIDLEDENERLSRDLRRAGQLIIGLWFLLAGAVLAVLVLL
jgi:hypothetical protein